MSKATEPHPDAEWIPPNGSVPGHWQRHTSAGGAATGTVRDWTSPPPVPTVAEARKAFDAARRTLIEAVHAALVARYRAANPASRAVSIIRYRRNGRTAKQRECVLCGETGPGWCGKYPRTVASQRWEREHIEHHVREEIGGVL